MSINEIKSISATSAETADGLAWTKISHKKTSKRIAQSPGGRTGSFNRGCQNHG